MIISTSYSSHLVVLSRDVGRINDEEGGYLLYNGLEAAALQSNKDVIIIHPHTHCVRAYTPLVV